MRMKLLDKALKQFGDDVNALHIALVRAGSECTLAALRNAQSRNNQSLKFSILSALVHAAFGGDWAKAGELIDAEFGTGDRADAAKQKPKK
jgi:hypothetical protein